MTSDRNALLDLLQRFNIAPTFPQASPLAVELRVGEPGITGYRDFLAQFDFNKDGSFKELNIWE